MTQVTKAKEKTAKTVFLLSAVLCIVAVVSIFGFLIYKSLPAFAKIGVADFVFGDDWSPDRLDTFDGEMSGSYGIFTMIVGTLCATLGALAVGGAVGYLCAVFLVFYCPRRTAAFLRTVINLLAGIPSVVYGFFGVVFLLPLLSKFAPNNGSGLLAVSLILGIMILPTVVSLTRTSLEAVPRSYYEGSMGVGATHTQTVFRVVSPAARSGIVASLVLGVGRALGETMAVVMIAGNAPTYPEGLFSSFRVLTANIVMEMGYAGELQEAALVATGVVLLVTVLVINLLFGFFSGRAVKKISKGGAKAARQSSLVYKRGVPEALRALCYAAGIAVCTALGLVLGFIFIKGLPPLISYFPTLFGSFEFGGESVSILPALVSTLYAVVLSIAIAVPIGIMTAIYLHEYASKDSMAVRAIRMANDILAGVPSIVYGLFGMISFVPLFGGSGSILAGALTVGMMLLPTVVRSTEESLAAVPDAQREASLALGAGKLRTVLHAVLPSALSGIASAVILSIGRVVGESAPFLYTAGSVISAFPRTPLDGGATLSVVLYQLSGEGWHIEEAYATALVLVSVVLLFNLLAMYGVRKIAERKG